MWCRHLHITLHRLHEHELHMLGIGECWWQEEQLKGKIPGQHKDSRSWWQWWSQIRYKYYGNGSSERRAEQLFWWRTTRIAAKVQCTLKCTFPGSKDTRNFHEILRSNLYFQKYIKPGSKVHRFRVMLSTESTKVQQKYKKYKKKSGKDGP